MVFPCNVLACLAMILSYYPNLSATTSHAIIQLWLIYLILPILALMEPDFSDSVLYGEIPYFYVHHVFLMIFPFYYLYTNKVTMIQSANLQWIILSGAFFGFMYITLVTPLAIVSGLNLNYMLHPPLGFPFDGPHYRIYSIGFFWSMFAITRILLVGLEMMMSWRKRKNSFLKFQ